MIQTNVPEINSPELILFWGFMHRCRCFWGDWAVYLEGLNGLLVREALERLSIHFQYLITWTVEKETFTSEKAQNKSQRQWKSSCHAIEVQQTIALSALQLLYHERSVHLPSFSLPSAAAAPLGKIVLTNIPILPRAESCPPTMLKLRPYTFKDTTIWAWIHNSAGGDVSAIWSCGSVVEHCVSSAKVVGSIPR